MNSYPNEFLAHPQPLMFVAGLTDGPSSPGPTTRGRSASVLSTSGSRRPSVNASSLLEPRGSEGLTSPMMSPGIQTMPLPNSPPDDSGAVVEDSGLVDERDREFEELRANLREALSGMGGKGKAWLAEGEKRNFRILLVDKGVRLPLRKIVPPSQPNESPLPPHSPLSPLSPSSPLYPDGLIAPIWVRKHAELIPSVFVLFLRLYESPLHPKVEQTAEEAQRRDKADRDMEKQKDDLLVKEVAERRRKLGERGIKLTVVLMASSATLDSPALDPRLSYLRRASALSAKASLFVLTPVPAEQLPDFVQSLQDALFDAAMEYYSNHAKRVRRKRSRVPVSQLGVPTPIQGGVIGRALGSQGWAVRYDWKAGWFAEVRGELDAARRHYEDCWNELARMFASTQMLPPRTKRWAEAKVLADCVAIRICRILLYEGEGPKALGPFFVHLKRFGDLSRGWGIGEETFEFWSWIARQYRIFAELLELGIQGGLRIPALAPPILPTAASAAAPPPGPDYFATPISSSSPLQVLQLPAFYYYTAACCSVQRKAKYEEALAVEQDAMSSEAGAASGYVSTAPGFANEKKIDHSALIVELFTKAYSLFKEQDPGHGRIALMVAFRIAETYCQSDQHNLAMRFFGRISSSFKHDRWTPIVRQIRGLWYECAQRTGNVESAARLLLEMMSPESGVDNETRAGLSDDLLSLLKTTSPSASEPLVVDMEDGGALIDVRAGFWQPISQTGTMVPFQIAMNCPTGVNIVDLPFSALHVSFLDDRPDVVIKSSENSPKSIDLGLITPLNAVEEQTAQLKWEEGERIVISGQLQGVAESEVQISSVKLVLSYKEWNIDVVFVPGLLGEWTAGGKTFIPVNELSSSVLFEAKPLVVSFDVKSPPSAYVGETVPLEVSVKNEDDRPVQGKLSVFLQPEDEDDGSTIALGSTVSKSLLDDISLGPLSPGESILKTLQLSLPRGGTKVVDFSLHGSVSLPSASETARTEEWHKTVVVPVLPPFSMQSKVTYRPTTRKGALGEALVGIILSAQGPGAIQIETVELQSEDWSEAKLLSSTLDMKGPASSFPQVWDSHVEYSISAHFAISPSRRASLSNLTSSHAALVFSWRRASSAPDTPLITTSLALPPLNLPARESFIHAHISPPTSVHLGQPFTLKLNLHNTHPSAAAMELSIQLDTADPFVWLGPRLSSLPDIPPGETNIVELRMMALGGTGWFATPNIRVFEGVEDLREEVRIVDLRETDGARDREGIMVFVRA
ncbi:Foie gras liver health family 1-domain-containing protein [Naematelia encephala]|uniref:Foie gras liver health family 1-domain-containing protein n=1 Tax=Naematelia encephala TaxID=71784 RepID=A0A1Y2BGF3_9TREE|nr:Foie gras liver health family 1-domain-containing protein [Naematelia encephala]